MAIQTFVQLDNIYGGAITLGVNRVIASAIANNATNLAEAYTVYICIIGCLMMWREMTYPTFMRHLLRANIIAILMTVQGFNTWIADPAMNAIPAWIAAATNNGGTVTAGAQQFQLLSFAVKHMEASILQQATGLDNIGYRAEVVFYNSMIQQLLNVGFWIYEFSKSIMGLLVASLPFVLFLYLFEATRQVPLRIAHKMMGIFILQIMLSIMLQIMIAGDSTFMISVANATGGLDEMLGTMEDICVFFTFGIGMVVVIPAIAAYVGGGIALGVGGAILSRAPGTLAILGGAAGRAGAAGSRAIARARS